MDAISLYELHRIKEEPIGVMYVSIGGAGKLGAIDNLKTEWCLTDNSIIIAVDNDEAGEECRNKNPNIRFIIPENKDWNEDLMKMKGL